MPADRGKPIEAGEDLLPGAFEHAADGLVLVDGDGIILRLNSQVESLFGYDRDELQGGSIQVLVPAGIPLPHRAGNIPRNSDRLLGTGFDLVGRHKSGTDFPVHVSLGAWQARRGRFVLTTIRDLTEQKQAEAALSRREEQARLLLEGTPDCALFLLDVDGYITSWNTGARNLKGYDAGDVLGKHLSVLYPPLDVQQGRPRQHLAAAIAQGRFEHEGWRLRKDGSQFWANAAITALRDPAGQLSGFVRLTRDLTEWRQAEEQMRLVVQTAEDMHSVRRECLANANHELRGSLSVIIGYSELLQEEDAGRSYEELLGSVNRISEASRQMGELVQDVMGIFRLETGNIGLELQSFDVASLLREVVMELSSLAEVSGNALAVRIAGEVGLAWSDPAKLRQLLIHVLTSICRLTSGGNMAVELGRSTDGGQEWLTFTISTSALDLPPSLAVETLFESLARADNATVYPLMGPALALLLSRLLGRMLGGDLTITARTVRDASFSLRLPARVSGALMPAHHELEKRLHEQKLDLQDVHSRLRNEVSRTSRIASRIFRENERLQHLCEARAGGLTTAWELRARPGGTSNVVAPDADPLP